MIARVTLDMAVRKEFDYLVPPEFASEVEVGTRVKVPFGHRTALGVVTELPESSPHTNLKPIEKVLGSQPQITPSILKLARWIAQYYCSPVEVALKAALPEAVRKEEAGYKERLHVRLLPGVALDGLTRKQQEICGVLQEHGELPLPRLLALAGTTAATVRRLEDKNFVEIAPRHVERDPYAGETILPTAALPLNEQQAAALHAITQAMDGKSAAKTFLLHGITGSGKTEVYLQALQHALSQDKGGIVLVPEISLTPQTVERFKARFTAGSCQTLVAVLHSHLSAGERHDEWQKIRQGRARVVIGARSAVFAPVQPLGLIVVDEEHEHSYKQEESPRYHARDVAVMRAHLENAVAVLGSATPSMESYYNAQTGKYQLLQMPQRADDKKLPIVRVVDMRMESKGDKGPPILSVRLKEAVTRRLEQKEQVILFLNRRGYSSSLQCPKCGYVAGCPNCSISLTYHRKLQQLCCHICGHHQAAPAVCPEPSCRNPAIRFAGIGTEKVEETLGKLFPSARIARMDSDTLKRKEDYRRVLGDFKTGKTDIIIGTQMIAKGLHFPNVTLVGIIYADLSLHIPDFRSGERTFQLLTQVAGRAGRGDVEGEVIVQAFTPFHPAIQFARQHDYEGFYEQEVEFRQQLRYPPIARAALITFKSRQEDKVRFAAEHVKKEIEKSLQGIPDLILAGAAPSPLLKAETFYRFQIMIRTSHMTRLAQQLGGLMMGLKLPEGVTLAVDIDPVNLF